VGTEDIPDIFQATENIPRGLLACKLECWSQDGGGGLVHRFQDKADTDRPDIIDPGNRAEGIGVTSARDRQGGEPDEEWWDLHRDGLGLHPRECGPHGRVVGAKGVF